MDDSAELVFHQSIFLIEAVLRALGKGSTTLAKAASSAALDGTDKSVPFPKPGLHYP
jgi:hypothetical protein